APWQLKPTQSPPPQVRLLTSSLQAPGPLSQSNAPPVQGQCPLVPPSQKRGPRQTPEVHSLAALQGWPSGFRAVSQLTASSNSFQPCEVSADGALPAAKKPTRRAGAAPPTITWPAS